MADNNLQIVLKYIQSGWPDYVDNIPVAVQQFFPLKNELSEQNGILTRGSRMLIPEVLRADILNRIHYGHQGHYLKFRRPNIMYLIRRFVKDKLDSWKLQ